VTASAAGYGVFVEYGSGDSVDVYRIGGQVDWEPKTWLPSGEGWETVGFWEGSVGYWKGSDTSPESTQSLDEVGAKAVLRVHGSGAGLRPYFEFGEGFRLLSHVHINANRGFATAFQFDNHIGLGLEFGSNGQYDVGYRFRHISNASIKHPNNGINVQELQLTYHFR